MTLTDQPRKLYLLDLDGVLADERHRNHLALDRKWEAYFAGIPEDVVWPQGQALYDRIVVEHALGLADFGYLTGRRYRHQGITVEWLNRHGFQTAGKPMIMRREYRDIMRLPEFKKTVIRELLLEDRSYDEVVLYDDDPRVFEEVNTLRPIGGHCVHAEWHVKPKKLVAWGRA